MSGLSAESEEAAGRGRACTGARVTSRVARASVGRLLLEVGSRVRYNLTADRNFTRRERGVAKRRGRGWRQKVASLRDELIG